MHRHKWNNWKFIEVTDMGGSIWTDDQVFGVFYRSCEVCNKPKFKRFRI